MTLLAVVLIGIIVLILFILGFIFGIVKINLEIYMSGQSARIEADVRLWRIKWLTVDIPEVKFDWESLSLNIKQNSEAVGKNVKNEKNFSQEELVHSAESLQDWVERMKESDLKELRLIKAFKVNHLKWYSTVGLKEAHWSGQAAGLIWTVKPILLHILSQLFTVTDKPQIDVKPEFNILTWRTHFSCMISFKLTKAMKAIYEIVKHNKRREQTACPNIQSKA